MFQVPGAWRRAADLGEAAGGHVAGDREGQGEGDAAPALDLLQGGGVGLEDPLPALGYPDAVQHAGDHPGVLGRGGAEQPGLLAGAAVRAATGQRVVGAATALTW